MKVTQPLFTVVQWQQLEYQALIFKYLKVGMPVPPKLLAPTHRSFQFSSPKRKKIDPEPGRGRRTGGKKWRCSRDAHPNSEYSKGHMIRCRYRSRKLVESQAAAPESYNFKFQFFL